MNNTSEKPILKVENLRIGYRAKSREIPIASNLNFSIGKGELVAIIGINGSGKSTLLKTLTKEISPLQGGVFIEESPLENYSNKSLAALISVVLTNQSISGNLNVFELVALGRQPYTNWYGNLSRTDIGAVNFALRQVGLQDLVEKKCNELSDGQLQKVLIARALAQDTSLILMDEPTTHLDLYHKAYVLQLLKKLTQETKKTILFASHEINLALQLCDKIILIDHSKTVCGSPDDLIQSGNLKSLFPADIIEFDTAQKSFRVKKT